MNYEYQVNYGYGVESWIQKLIGKETYVANFDGKTRKFNDFDKAQTWLSNKR